MLVYERGICQNLHFGHRWYIDFTESKVKQIGRNCKQFDENTNAKKYYCGSSNGYVSLDPEKCTIGGQNEDSGKFHVRIRAPRHRRPPMVHFSESNQRWFSLSHHFVCAQFGDKLHNLFQQFLQLFPFLLRLGKMYHRWSK